MISLYLVFLILFAHYFGDFILQTNEMAINKSKSFLFLIDHIMMYMIGIFMIMIIPAAIGLFKAETIIIWTILNGGIHFVFDFVTSKINAKLRQKENKHNFFWSNGTICLYDRLPAIRII